MVWLGLMIWTLIVGVLVMLAMKYLRSLSDDEPNEGD